MKQFVFIFKVCYYWILFKTTGLQQFIPVWPYLPFQHRVNSNTGGLKDIINRLSNIFIRKSLVKRPVPCYMVTKITSCSL